MFKKIAHGILFFGLLSGSALLMSANNPTLEARAVAPKTYPATAEVVELDQAADLVIVKTSAGIGYRFMGCEDWLLGDLVAMTMNDSGTPETVLDDEIIEARYSGYRMQ